MVLLDNSIQCIEIQNVNLEYGVFERFGCFFSHTHDAWVSYRICSKDICSIHKNPLSYSGHPKNGTHARTHAHTHTHTFKILRLSFAPPLVFENPEDTGSSSKNRALCFFWDPLDFQGIQQKAKKTEKNGGGKELSNNDIK